MEPILQLSRLGGGGEGSSNGLNEFDGHSPPETPCPSPSGAPPPSPPPLPSSSSLTATAPAPYRMGYFGSCAYVIGNIIGGGIFISPATILRHTDSVGLSLVIWVVGAVIAILGSLLYVELGTSIRDPGCDFAYICYLKWYSIAFAFMQVSVLMTYPATIAIISETFGQYLLEGLRQSYDIDEEWVPLAQKLFGISLLWIVTWINFFELGRFAARFQIVVTVAKLLACSLIILTGLYYLLIKGSYASLEAPFHNVHAVKAGDLTLGLFAGLYAYSGWDVLNFSMGEIHHAKRNMPLALLSGIGTVSIIYFLINIAYFAVLDVESLKSTNAVAALFSQRTLGGFSYAIPFLIGVLLVGSLNSNLFAGSRYMFAAARMGHLPSCFSCVNYMTASPRVSIFAQSALAIGISFVGDLDSLIGYCMFGFWAQRMFTLIALVTIRCKNIPVHPEAIRMPLPLILLFLVINVILVLIPIVQEFQITCLGIFICLVGFGCYFIFVAPTSMPAPITRLNELTTFIASIVFDGLPDLKAKPAPLTPTSLLTSDSQQLLLLPKRSSFSGMSTDDGSSTLDLHADEKNKLIRNSSGSGLRMW